MSNNEKLVNSKCLDITTVNYLMRHYQPLMSWNGSSGWWNEIFFVCARDFKEVPGFRKSCPWVHPFHFSPHHSQNTSLLHLCMTGSGLPLLPVRAVYNSSQCTNLQKHFHVCHSCLAAFADQGPAWRERPESYTSAAIKRMKRSRGGISTWHLPITTVKSRNSRDNLNILRLSLLFLLLIIHIGRSQLLMPHLL